MPPFHPPLKNDGPACRVCGCTEHNACLIDDAGCFDLGMTCSWARTTGTDSGPLCSACAGTVDDALNVIRRTNRLLDAGNIPAARQIARAFILRAEARKKALASPG